jgi:hypothetical protein
VLLGIVVVEVPFIAFCIFQVVHNNVHDVFGAVFELKVVLAVVVFIGGTCYVTTSVQIDQPVAGPVLVIQIMGAAWTLRDHGFSIHWLFWLLGEVVFTAVYVCLCLVYLVIFSN